MEKMLFFAVNALILLIGVFSDFYCTYYCIMSVMARYTFVILGFPV